MKIKQNIIERIIVFFQNCANNSSHTLSADIQEFFMNYVLSVRYYTRYIFPQRYELKRTKELKNTKKGKKCFVFANGPSMNLLGAKKIEQYQKAGFDVICVNSHIISDMAKTVVPNYYVLSDPISFGASENIVPDDVIETQKRQIDRLNDLNIPVFIPAQFSNLNVLNYYYIFNDFGNRFIGNIDITKPRGYIELTGYKAVAIACYLGYEAIYICGFDNDYFKTIFVDENNIIYHIDRHYYDEGKKCIAPCNSGKGMGNLLWDHHRRFKDFELFSRYNIINLDKNGLVDVFTKKHNLDIYTKT